MHVNYPCKCDIEVILAERKSIVICSGQTKQNKQKRKEEEKKKEHYMLFHY